MKRVETYDQYKAIYGDPSDYTSTLIHPSSGFTTVNGEVLTESEAVALVNSLYEDSKTLGKSYSDKLINLEGGYAELTIDFTDGKKLTRVISIVG